VLPLLGQTIGENLEDVAARWPDADALVVPFQGVRLGYHELNAAVDELARALIGAGLEKGDRLGIWSPNNLEWVLVQYATAKAGIVLVNVNPAYRTSEAGYALEQSGCRMVVAATTFRDADYVGMLAEVGSSLSSLERVVHLGTDDWVELLAEADGVCDADLRARMSSLDIDDPINIQYTSGTTGFPKGATLTHHNILNNGYFVGEACRYGVGDRVCIPVPLYHCFGMVLGNLACTTHGATIVLPAPSFDADATLVAVAAERCTSLYGVPTMFIAELGHHDFASFDLTSLRTGIMAGASCPVEVMRRCMTDMHMEEVTICYGMTELSPVSTQTAVDDPVDRRVMTVGRAHPHVEVKVIHPETGKVVPRGEPGEVCARGYSVMRGYWNDPERTAEAIDTGGWMHTGDLGVMDPDGYLNIVGRIKDMIIRGGENVYPREIEEFLYAHPDIVDVQVIGVPDERYGEEIMAWVRTRDGTTVSQQDIADYCRGRIAHYKVPRYVHVTDDFPMTVTGKIQKYRMREQAIQMLGLQAAASTATA
jgi:fatty-acyl-CoA synthase